MKHLVLTLIFLFSMSASVNANSVNGTFVCELVFSDGSGYDVYITTTESGMIQKDIEYGDQSKYLEIHRGKTNDFRVFVEIGSWLNENIIVLMATEDQRVFHYHGSTTMMRDTVTARAIRGNCKKM